MTTPLTDREAWQQACSGDAESFGLLYDRHVDAIYGYVLRRTGSWSDAEDLTSAVFLLAWLRRTQVVLDRESALPWLFGVARYALANHRRTASRYRRAATHDEGPHHIPGGDLRHAWAGQGHLTGRLSCFR